MNLTSPADEPLRTPAQRLDRLLTALERAKRNPNRREAYYALFALECLQTSEVDRSLEAILNAERGPPSLPRLPTSRARMTL